MTGLEREIRDYLMRRPHTNVYELQTRFPSASRRGLEQTLDALVTAGVVKQRGSAYEGVANHADS